MGEVGNAAIWALERVSHNKPADKAGQDTRE